MPDAASFYLWLRTRFSSGFHGRENGPAADAAGPLALAAVLALGVSRPCVAGAEIVAERESDERE